MSISGERRTIRHLLRELILATLKDVLRDDCKKSYSGELSIMPKTIAVGGGGTATFTEYNVTESQLETAQATVAAANPSGLSGTALTSAILAALVTAGITNAAVVPPSGPIAYASDNPSVATIDPATGAYVGVSAGTANITGADPASPNDVVAGDTLTVTAVAPPPPSNVAQSASLNL